MKYLLAAVKSQRASQQVLGLFILGLGFLATAHLLSAFLISWTFSMPYNLQIKSIYLIDEDDEWVIMGIQTGARS